MKEFKNKIKDLIDAIPDINLLERNPSIFSDDIIKHDCDACPFSKFNTGDVYDESICRGCWKEAIDNC